MPIEFDSKWRKARKNHQCDMCSGTIHKGEKYYWAKYIEDELYELKVCRLCNEIIYDVEEYLDDWRQVWEEGVTFDDYHMWATDTDYPDTPDKKAWRERSGYTRYDEED